MHLRPLFTINSIFLGFVWVAFSMPAFARDGELELGVGEANITGGVSSTEDFDKANGVAAIGAGFGLSRWFALTGDYAYHRLNTLPNVTTCTGTFCTITSGRANLHEFTGGVRLSVPTAGRVTPFVTGSLGGARLDLEYLINNRLTTQETIKLAYGGGAGLDVRINDWFGLRWDARALNIHEQFWIARTTFGFYFRGR